MVTEARRGAQDVVQLQVCYYRAPVTRMDMHSVRLSCMMSVTCGPARVCESLLLTRAVYRSASQNHRRGCWIVDYINSIGHTPLESRCRHVLGSAITDLVIRLIRAVCASIALRRLPAARNAASCHAQMSGTRGRGAGATHGAKGAAVGAHGQRWDAIALNLLLEG